MNFLDFSMKLHKAEDFVTQRPALEVDDIIVVDNLAAHHGEAEQALRDFFNDILIELLFLPVYSPDLNPVEEVFSKLKYLLKYRYQDSVFENLEYAVLRAVGDITSSRPVWILQACKISDLKSWFHLFQAGSKKNFCAFCLGTG